MANLCEHNIEVMTCKECCRKGELVGRALATAFSTLGIENDTEIIEHTLGYTVGLAISLGITVPELQGAVELYYTAIQEETEKG